MFVKPLIILFSLSWGTLTFAEEPPLKANLLGGASTKEAGHLFSAGKQAFERRQYDTCIQKLERLRSRYPGAPGFLEAPMILAKCRFEKGDIKGASQNFKEAREFYRRSSKHQDLEIETIIRLAECGTLPPENLAEIYALTLEAERHPGFSGFKISAPDLAAHVFILRSRVDLKKGRLKDAEINLTTARSLGFRDPATFSEVQLLKLQSKVADCKRYPTAEPLTEEQVLDQLRSLAGCTQQALNELKELARLLKAPATKTGSNELLNLLQHFSQTCKTPPSPPELHPTPRTETELRAYQRELREKTSIECKNHFSQFSMITKDWERLLPKESLPIVQPVIEATRGTH